MKKNMGSVDKIIRIAFAAFVTVLYFTNIINGTIAAVLGILAVALVLTSFISFCPMYLPFGISTFKKKNNDNRN